MKKKIVYFLQAGNPYGYGYHADEVGLIDEGDFVALQKGHIVRVASNEEIAEYEAKAGAALVANKPAKGGSKGGSTAKDKAEGTEAEAEAARKLAEAEAEAARK